MQLDLEQKKLLCPLDVKVTVTKKVVTIEGGLQEFAELLPTWNQKKTLLRLN